MRIILLLTLFSLSSCALNSPKNEWNINSQSLDGTWRLEIIDEEQGSSDIHDVTVPGNWNSSGIEHSGVGYYSRTFSIADIGAQSRYWLQLDAVDYESAVIVNGKLLKKGSGYFIPLNTEVSNVINEGINDLNVWVNSPNEPLTKDWSLNKTLIKGVLNHHDTRPGGAWSERGQDQNSGGIWGGVTLRETGPVAIQQVKILPSVLDVNSGLTTANITLSIDSRVAQNATFEVALTSNNEQEVELYRYEKKLEFGQKKVTVQLPEAVRKLWWPWDL
ncbi:hypothetical protein L4D09_22130 [Photobacterium makurazakiensis]|uniref:sugar-binding domain-containing protein n=1 Tax=Photobacterium makurazakiensis TaxID=2910234 RepID=UPI003D12F3BB